MEATRYFPDEGLVLVMEAPVAPTWTEAYLALRADIAADPQFTALVRGYGGNPDSHSPSRRAGQLANAICSRLGLDPAVYRGNVFGAAADAARARSITAIQGGRS